MRVKNHVVVLSMLTCVRAAWLKGYCQIYGLRKTAKMNMSWLAFAQCFLRLPNIAPWICESSMGLEYMWRRLPSVSKTWSSHVWAACVMLAAMARGSRTTCNLSRWLIWWVNLVSQWQCRCAYPWTSPQKCPSATVHKTTTAASFTSASLPANPKSAGLCHEQQVIIATFNLSRWVRGK